jgi:hypothetical protein
MFIEQNGVMCIDVYCGFLLFLGKMTGQVSQVLMQKLKYQICKNISSIELKQQCNENDDETMVYIVRVLQVF